MNAPLSFHLNICKMLHSVSSPIYSQCGKICLNALCLDMKIDGNKSHLSGFALSCFSDGLMDFAHAIRIPFPSLTLGHDIIFRVADSL